MAVMKKVAPKPKVKATPTPKPNWRKAPPDYDVIIPGYNDKATVKKLNDAAKKKAKKK